ncbi:TonB-dependent receptor [Pseudomonas moorei]|nr:TonB-dependent receptor [Pseudomonas moorei]
MTVNYSRAATMAAALGFALPVGYTMADDSVINLPVIDVNGRSEITDSLAPSVEQEALRLASVPGGSNLAQPSRETRLGSLRDALGYQPGILIQDFSGGIDQPRFNIRGSGIQSNPISRGVLLLEDDLPVNDADGSFIIGLLEPRNSAWVSALRGGNALNPAASALGGEVNFRTLTGLDENGSLRLEGGSFGRLGWQTALGGADENLDGRISMTGDEYDGFRHHSQSQRRTLSGNVGLSLDNGFENRTYLSWADLAFDIPFVVPGSRIDSDPDGVMGDGNTLQDKQLNVYARDPNRHIERTRLANRSSWLQGDTRHTFGIYYQNTNDAFKNLLVDTPSKTDTVGAQWRVEGRLGDLDYRFGAGLDQSVIDRSFYAVSPTDGSRLKRFGDYDLEARNLFSNLDLTWNLDAEWSLLAGLRYTDSHRDASENSTGKSLNQQWDWFAPKVGVNWRPNEKIRWYATISTQREVPTFWEVVTSDANAANPNLTSTELLKLRAQKARTFELGVQGAVHPMLNWDITVYRSEIRDELIATTDASGIRTGTYNYADRTRHQGVELGLHGSDDHYSYRLAWTYSDFRFVDGVLEGNQIAGVPRNLINAELMRRLGRWQVGGNVYWLPDGSPIDHVNTPGLEQNSYVLFGLKAIYEASSNWSFNVQGDNLANRRYESSYVTRYQATAAQPTFTAGNGRSFSAGFSYRF